MKDFKDKLAVVTGAGTGMGRELARQLTAAGCHVAMCDVSAETMAETVSLCRADAPDAVRVSAHLCDVSEESQVVAFRDAVVLEHKTNHINLLFNNAGISGGGSFIKSDRAEWERTFAVCWGGVYHCTRVLLPLLIASEEGCLVNISSVNGFWATIGPGMPHTAYSSAKFAVKGFSEALIADLRLHAPHVKVAVVMPGHVGTSILLNSPKLHGQETMSAQRVAEVREMLLRRGLPVADAPDDAIRAGAHQFALDFRDNAPLSAAQAAAIILDGVRNDRWRILVGEDAQALDRLVRESPEEAYEPSLLRCMLEQGHFGGRRST